MRQILNLETGKHEMVDDQVAADAIAAGKAVPSIEKIETQEFPQRETAAVEVNLEVK